MLELKDYAAAVNERLQTIIIDRDANNYEEGNVPGLLTQSMRYSLLAGGKRLRPSMFLAAVDMLGGDWQDAIDFSCSIEMIHSYSLIHDDLPGMDNDTMRRGRPTNHVVFGVGQAILAGDGLLNLAFENMFKWSMSRPKLAYPAIQAMSEIATGAGVTGMIAGQVADLQCENNALVSEEALSFIHRDKTACMFIYPLRAAARIACADEKTVDALGHYGECFGHVFQITDDLLDVCGTVDNMGKTLGKDAEQGKLTAVSMYGIEGARNKALEYTEKGIEALQMFGESAGLFRNLLNGSVKRNK